MKVAIVTGGAKGIGKAIAKKLIDDGFKVVVADIKEIVKSKKSCEGAIFKKCDVSSEKDVKELINFVTSKFKRIDLIVNNAGIMITKPIEELSFNEWKKVLDINLSSIFLTTKYAKEYLIEFKGKIINIASTRAFMSEPNTEAYSASKGGVIALTHSLASSLTPNVLVNSISPGWIDTREWIDEELAALSGLDHSQHLSGRVGKPEDISSLISWLAEDENGFVTGVNFVVDGGMTKKMIYLEE